MFDVSVYFLFCVFLLVPILYLLCIRNHFVGHFFIVYYNVLMSDSNDQTKIYWKVFLYLCAQLIKWKKIYSPNVGVSKRASSVGKRTLHYQWIHSIFHSLSNRNWLYIFISSKSTQIIWRWSNVGKRTLQINTYYI